MSGTIDASVHTPMLSTRPLQEGNKGLEEAVTRLTLQKKALQMSLQRRDGLVRAMSGALYFDGLILAA